LTVPKIKEIAIIFLKKPTKPGPAPQSFYINGACHYNAIPNDRGQSLELT